MNDSARQSFVCKLLEMTSNVRKGMLTLIKSSGQDRDTCEQRSETGPLACNLFSPPIFFPFVFFHFFGVVQGSSMLVEPRANDKAPPHHRRLGSREAASPLRSHPHGAALGVAVSSARKLVIMLNIAAQSQVARFATIMSHHCGRHDVPVP
jgi:hypothetical protein